MKLHMIFRTLYERFKPIPIWCLCGLQDILDTLGRIILVDSPSAQLISYDTTFQLGDFYVSPLLFRHTLFKEKNSCASAFSYS